MKKILLLGAALLAGYTGFSNASSVGVLSADGAFAGNSADALTTLSLLDNAQIAANLSDIDPSTYLFGSTSGGTVSAANLTLSFGETVVNGAGADFAFYFMGGSAEVNTVQACFTANCDLAAADLFTASQTFDASGNALAVSLGEFNDAGEIFYGISSIAVDLSLYGFADGAELGEFSIDLMAGGYNRLAGVESFNTASVSPVPVPAAVWLFVSGALAMLGFARRRQA